MSGLPLDLPRSRPFTHPKPPQDGNHPLETAANLMGPTTNAALPTMASPTQGTTIASAGERSIGKPVAVDTRASAATTAASPSSCRLGPPSSSEGVVLNGTSVVQSSRIGLPSNTADANLGLSSPSSLLGTTTHTPTPTFTPTVAQFAAMQKAIGLGPPVGLPPPALHFTTTPTHVGVPPAVHHPTAAAASATAAVGPTDAPSRATLQQTRMPHLMPAPEIGVPGPYSMPGAMYQAVSGAAGSVFGGVGFVAAGAGAASRSVVQQQVAPQQQALLLPQPRVTSSSDARVGETIGGSPSTTPVANPTVVAAGSRRGSTTGGAEGASMKEPGDDKMKPPPARKRYDLIIY